MSTRPTTTPPWYDTLEAYGPFHRKTKDGTHPHALFAEMAANGELWGRGRVNSPNLAALAFYGPLPEGKSGIEFFTFLEPDKPWGGEATWFTPPYGEAREEQGWAKIDVVIRRASEDCI
jgi:hypothetical protein